MHPFGGYLIGKSILDDRHREAELDRRSLATRTDAPPDPTPDPRQPIPRAPAHRRIGLTIRRLVTRSGHA